MSMHLLNELFTKGQYDYALYLCVEWYLTTKVFKSTALWYIGYIERCQAEK